MIETDTTLCETCQIPVPLPAALPLNPFMSFRPVPLCKDCLYLAQVEAFNQKRFSHCPYQVPHWRPRP